MPQSKESWQPDAVAPELREVAAAESEAGDAHLLTDALVTDSSPFIGRWNRLVSTTNWEKGRIISEWRGELVRGGASPSVYADATWAQLVGHVTPQHVGRLRRVHERFGKARDKHDGLFWSHYQAALDWDDAEMWLEGAVREDWSVAQMRAARWEAVGAPDGVGPDHDEVFEGEIGAGVHRALGEPSEADSEEIPPTEPDDRAQARARDDGGGRAAEEADAPSAGVARSRPFEGLSELPDDLADALEQMKLAILSHKLSGWRDVGLDSVLAALEALKTLALSPADEA